MAATVYKRLHNASIGGGVLASSSSGGASGGGVGSSSLLTSSSGSSATAAGASPMLGHSQLTRSLERILEEAHFSGELILTNRKLKDFPKMGAKFSLQDTVIAGELPLLWARLLVEIFLLLFGIKINNLQQPVACCLCSSLSLSFRWLLRSHALALLMFFALCRRLLLPCYRLPKDNNYCSCFFFIFFSVSSFSFRVCTIRGDFFFFWVDFFLLPFSSSANFRFCCARKCSRHTHRYTLSGHPTHTHPPQPTDNHPDEETICFHRRPASIFSCNCVLCSVSFAFPFFVSLFIKYLS